ncbi:MAG: hypothetical protein IPH33_12720 [Bacteroidetes bacterium]|nr:hypothetical protein [Bacteroidota bacterium]
MTIYSTLNDKRSFDQNQNRELINASSNEMEDYRRKEKDVCSESYDQNLKGV